MAALVGRIYAAEVVAVVAVAGVAAGAELADPRTVRKSHLARQSLVISMSKGTNFVTVELAATRARLKTHLPWPLETWDLRAAEAGPGLHDAETVVVVLDS